MKFKKYHKIGQFKDIVRSVRTRACFDGLDEDGQPIYKTHGVEYPVIKFRGTIKLHGTNAGVSYTPEAGIRGLKRGSLLSADVLDGHFGFNQFLLAENKEYFTKLMESVYSTVCEDGDQLNIYGEWAGGNIQKGVGISNSPKAFYIFDMKVTKPGEDGEDVGEWLDIADLDLTVNGTLDVPDNVRSILEFETYEMDIDFNKPEESQNKLVDITNTVEESCPVAKAIGQSGIGEGVVWTGFHEGAKLIMKVKGAKHSVTKTKNLAPIDPDVLRSINEFVDYACTQNRIEQAITETNATEKKHVPDILRWLANDIIAEESDTLKANGLEWKQVVKEVSTRARNYYFTKLDKVY